MGDLVRIDEHIVNPSSSIVNTVDWLASHGVTRAWYLHGRSGSGVIWQENYRETPSVAQQGDYLEANYFINPPRVTIIPHGPEPAYHLEEHDFEPGHSGRTCEKMLTDDEGYGESCGRTVYHPCHKKWREAEAARMAANMIENGDTPDPTDAANDHVSGEAAADPHGVVIPRRGRIYVAGPMTGLPDFNYPAFRHAASELVARGFAVEDPSTNELPEGSAWVDYMRVTIPQMLRCDAVALLPGWEKSKGATLEVYIAKELGLTIMEIEEWMHDETQSRS